MIIARQSTSRTVTVGPVLDADGVAVTGGVVGDFKISKNGGAPAALNGSATLTHRHTGHYSLALTASDLDTVGQAEVVIDDTVNSCPVKELTVIEEAVYDAMFAASALGYQVPIWAAANSTVNLSATTIKTATDVEADTADIQTRLPAALVSGRMSSDAVAIGGNTTVPTNMIIVYATDFTTNYNTTVDRWNVNLTAINGAENPVGDLDTLVIDYAQNGALLCSIASITGDVAGKVLGGGLGTFTGVGAKVDVVEFNSSTLATTGLLQMGESWVNDGNDALRANLLLIGGDDLNTGYVRADVSLALGTLLTEGAAGRMAASISAMHNVASPLFTTASVNQSGDSFARIGANGASLTSLAPAATALSTATWTSTHASKLNQLPDVAAGSNGGVLIAGSNAATTFATLTSTGAFTINGVSNVAQTGDSFAVVTSGTFGNAALKTLIDALGTAVAAVPSAAANAAALLDSSNAIETGLTPRGAFRLISAACAGKLSGGGTATETFRNAVQDSKDRIVATVDASGNRTAITADVT